MQETMSQAEVAAIIRGDYVRQKPTKQPPLRLEITIPIPPSRTKPNAGHGHMQAVARAVKQQRMDAATAAKLALINGNHQPPMWERAEVQATFWRRHPNSRLMDQDNAVSWLKHTWDGLQDAGIVRNDRGLTHLPPIQRLGKEACGRNEVVLDIVGK